MRRLIHGLLAIALAGCAQQPPLAPALTSPESSNVLTPPEPPSAPIAPAAIAPATSAEPVSAPIDCAGAPACRSEGRCTLVGTGCTVGSSDDCKNSDLCKKQGACIAVEGECAKGCRQSHDCKQYGMCTAQDGSCVATKAADCRASEVCKNEGACSLLEGGCGQGTTAECNRTPDCEGNRCFFFEGFCRQKGPCACAFGGGAPPPRDAPPRVGDDPTVLRCVRAGGSRPDGCKLP